MKYFQVGGQNPKFSVTLKDGSAEGEEINLIARYQTDEGEKTMTLQSDVVIPGKRTVLEWDITEVLKKEELFQNYIIELVLGEVDDEEEYKARKVDKNAQGIVIYKPTLEITAVDNKNKPIEGAECRLSVYEDRNFDPEGMFLVEPNDGKGPNGEKIWKGITDKDGKVSFPGLPLGRLRIDWTLPFMLTTKEWLTEGDFTETGAMRKAELRKRPEVNYIWWGNPSKEKDLKSAATTPNDMAQLKYNGRPGVKVNLWCQNDAATLHGQLDGLVNVHKITSLSDLMCEDGFAIHSVFMGRGKQLDAVLNALSEYKFYSAAKDLISLCVMYKHGGYYFDTTTIVPLDDPEGFCETLDKLPNEIRFPSTAGGGGSYSCYRHDPSAFATVFANTKKLNENIQFWSGNLDVWALYAPPRHPALAMMVDSYINRCVALGLDSFPNKKLMDFGTESEMMRGEKWIWKDVWNGLTFHDFATNACRPDVDNDPGLSARNNIIGNLIITSVQEGMQNYMFEFQGEDVPDEGGVKSELAKYLWNTGYPGAAMKAKHSPAKVQAFLPEYMDMPKAHSGSWRDKK